ncbi:MAG: hypothetical protein H6569_09455 [Lewinellaceae bacterium]|nr:hypothetical protein [Lewinellaceae bacterium]
MLRTSKQLPTYPDYQRTKYYSASPVFKLVPAGQTAPPVQFAHSDHKGQINDAAVSVVQHQFSGQLYQFPTGVRVENQGTIPLFRPKTKLVLDPQQNNFPFEPNGRCPNR